MPDDEREVHGPDAPAPSLADQLAGFGIPLGEEVEPEPPPPQMPSTDKEGIHALGHDRGVYYYFSSSTGQVEPVPAERHTRAMLTHLASEAHYWRRSVFMGEKGVDWNAAADNLRGRCRAVGIFDRDRLRGRGAWLDGDRSVLHLGDRLIVDGTEQPLHLPDSRYVYEHAARLPAELGPALPALHARRLMDLCMAAPFERPDIMGRLLAGWCVVAPVCGAMPWRPHLWLTSESANGKTWILDNIVRPLVSSVALEVASKTTEAGIRQTLGCDARPVIFDEAETQNEQDRQRVQLVLDLARQASSEDGAAIIKGHHSGKAMWFRIRSCFVFSSINLGLTQAADESRTVVLTLALHHDPDRRVRDFANLKRLHADVMRPGFAAGLLARTLALLPSIRANAVVFAEAIARSGQSRRVGDTYGVLLAGAWSLRSNKIATPEEADEFVVGTSWVRDAVTAAAVEPEWKRALSAMRQHRERLQSSNMGPQDVPIGELIEIVCGRHTDPPASAAICAQALSRVGIRIGFPKSPAQEYTLFVANNSSALARVFERTPWASSWLATLSRAPKAQRSIKSMRFGGDVSKALAIPLEHLWSD